MPKFLITFDYSSGSWARMLQIADDRYSAVAELMEHLHGKLELMYWGVESAQAYVIADLPDSQSATAAITVATKTGAFKDVEAHEVLTQDQLREVVALAKSSEGIYHPPGSAAIERDLVTSG
jgi:GYD domain